MVRDFGRASWWDFHAMNTSCVKFCPPSQSVAPLSLALHYVQTTKWLRLSASCACSTPPATAHSLEQPHRKNGLENNYLQHKPPQNAIKLSSKARSSHMEKKGNPDWVQTKTFLPDLQWVSILLTNPSYSSYLKKTLRVKLCAYTAYNLLNIYKIKESLTYWLTPLLAKI